MNDTSGYQLLDTGEGKKLERFGEIVLIRPEERATWGKGASRLEWDRADFEFRPGMGWTPLRGKTTPYNWVMELGGFRIQCELEESRQVGLFPENEPHWHWIERECLKRGHPRVLNLFGYTGLASLAAVRGGASVTHVEASRRAMRLGKLTKQHSGLEHGRVRWIQDDALEFVRREGRRGNSYAGIILDPPAYGLGPRKQRWEFEKYAALLMGECRRIFTPEGGFVVLTAYSLGRLPDFLLPILALMTGTEQAIETGILALTEKSLGRKLNLSIYAHWSET